jgi:hypothetical protein
VDSIRHGVDGWVLEEMIWRETDGRARFTYSRDRPGGVVEEYVRIDEQPYEPAHAGWSRN